MQYISCIRRNGKKIRNCNTQRLDNAVEAVLSGLSSDTIRNVIPELESRKSALEGEIRRLSAGMPDLKLEHFEYFMHHFSEFEKSDQEKQHLIDTLICRVVVYPEHLVILINVTDTTQIPPLQQITAALEGSCNVSNGGANRAKLEPSESPPFVAFSTSSSVTLQLSPE